MERKLTAILCADVYGYSRLMGQNEEATLRTLSSYRKFIDSLIEQHHGRFVNSAGDSVLAEFVSVVHAVQCAVDIQTTLKAENAELPPERRMQFRIGVNLGDVMVEGEQIYGDGVNVAARLEGLAEPGGVCISGTVHDQVRDKLTLTYEDRGEQVVKNIARPVRVWRVLLDEAASSAGKMSRTPRRYWRGGAVSIAGVAIAIVTFLIVQHLSLKPPHTAASIPPPEKPALALPVIPSIVVLPFTNMSNDREQEYFSDGITDELTTDLSRISGLFVIARTSAFTYKGKAVKVQEVSRELGVKYVLEGSVRKADKRVRITAQLVDATSGDELWAERYDRPMSDIFALQDEIAKRIVTTMNLQLTLLKQGVLVTQRTNSLEAYDYYLRGIEFFIDMLAAKSKQDSLQAQSMFEKAIELDPQYSDAYAWLGWVQFSQGFLQWSHDYAVSFARAIQLQQRSIALDNLNSFAYAGLSGVYDFTRQYDLSLAAARRAIAVDSNSALGYSALAFVLCDLGKPAEAISPIHKAERLDPHGYGYYAFVEGRAYYLMGRYAYAIPPLKISLESPEGGVPSLMGLVFCYVETGRIDEAKAAAAEIMRINPQFSLMAQRQMCSAQPTICDRIYNDLARAGLK